MNMPLNADGSVNFNSTLFALGKISIRKVYCLHISSLLGIQVHIQGGGAVWGAPPGFSESEEKEHCHSPQQ